MKGLITFLLVLSCLSVYAQDTERDSTEYDSTIKKTLIYLGEIGQGSSLWAIGRNHAKVIADPLFKTYVCLSGSIDNIKEPSFSFEFGRWGMNSPITFGIDIDHNYNKSFKQPTTWIGPKLYYTIYQKENFSYMIYGSPKYQLGGNGFLLENGIVMYYNINANTIFGFSQYFQSSQVASFVPGLSVSIIKLF